MSHAITPIDMKYNIIYNLIYMKYIRKDLGTVDT